MSTAIELVNMEQKAEQEMAPVLARAREFAVLDQQSYEAADSIIAEIRAKVKDPEKGTEVTFASMKQSATKMWKDALAIWKRFVDDPLEVCKILDRKRYQWKKNEDDRRAREAEEMRKAEEKRRADERLALAVRLEKEGMKEQAQQIVDAPAAPVDVPAPVKVQVAQGQSQVENWQARVVDEKLIPREYLAPDLVALGKLAKLLKGKASVPGVEFFDLGSVRRRS